MKLERIDIAGFRGIKRLSLPLNELTTLIGENTWGKSSLLDALSVALPADGSLYSFEIRDFHVDYAVSHPQSQSIQIILTFSAIDKHEIHSGRYRKLKPIWQLDENLNHKIYYRISASRQGHTITQNYTFLDVEGRALPLHHSEKIAQELMTLHPIIRLRDSRRFYRNDPRPEQSNSRIEKRINNTCRRLISKPGHVDKAEIKSTLNSMRHLVEHYFSFKSQSRTQHSHRRDGVFYNRTYHDGTLVQLIDNTNNHQTRLLLLGLLNAYLQAKGPNQLKRCARPILLIEDPEGRLHPTHLARAWSLLQMLPMQKIVTTNSSDLLSTVPMRSIRRLVRQSGRTTTTQLAVEQFSQDELRRVGFHIRFHRPKALFARCWLLVEGETEVWLFNELANLCGYNLAAEGVQIIEFAQSGLKSLIKVAKSLGIEWHVVTDGDPAGKKYAATVLHQLKGDHPRHHLTELPDRDIEHFLYQHGFEDFFRDLVKIPPEHPVPAKKVVTRVLKKFAKPDLALTIVAECEKRGMESIPLLIRWILKRVVTMANGNT